MKLHEMFDRQQAMDDFNKDTDHQDHETSIGDMIITRFELGEITYEEALQQLKKQGMEVYIHELNMADELKDSNNDLH